MDDRPETRFPYFYGLNDDDYDHVIKSFKDVIVDPSGFFMEYTVQNLEKIILVAAKAFTIEYLTGSKTRLLFGEGAREVLMQLFRTETNFIIPLQYQPQHFAGRKSLKLKDGCQLKNLDSHSQVLVASATAWKLYDNIKTADRKGTIRLDNFAKRFRLNVSGKLNRLGLPRVKKIEYVKFTQTNPMFAGCALTSLWVTARTMHDGLGGTYNEYGLEYLLFKDSVCQQVEERGQAQAGGTQYIDDYYKDQENKGMEAAQDEAEEACDNN